MSLPSDWPRREQSVDSWVLVLAADGTEPDLAVIEGALGYLADRPDLVAEARRRARARGFVPYVAGVAVDRLAPDLATSGSPELDR